MKYIFLLLFIGTANAQQVPTGPVQFVKSGKAVNVSDQTGFGLPIAGTIVATNPSVSTTGSAVPTSATLIAGSDGTNLKSVKVSATGVVSVDGSATTQPVSAASLPLPTGASTSALQTTGNTSLSNIDTKTPALVSGRVPVDGSGVTQPVSVASLPLPSGGSTSANQTSGGQKTQIVDGSGNVISSSGNQLYVIQPDEVASGTITSTQAVSIPLDGSGTVSIQLSGTWTGTVTLQGSNDGVTWYSVPGIALTSGNIASNFSANNLIQAGVAGYNSFRVLGNTVASGTVTVSLHSNAQSGVFALSNAIPSGTNTIGSISNISGTVSLPTGASTSALQTTGNTSLSSIDTKIPSNLTVTSTRLLVDGSGVTQPVSAASLPLPTGAATSANQATTNSSLSTIATNTAKVPFSVTGSGSGAGATVSTVTTLTAPANAVGFVLMNLDTSTANIRWAVGRTASTTLGQQLQPGRDTGFIPIGASVSVIAESGTQNIDIQWIAQ